MELSYYKKFEPIDGKWCEYNPDTDSYNYEFSSDSEIFVLKKYSD